MTTENKPESPKEGEKIMHYQDLDEMAIAYLEMQYDPGYVRARLAENNYAPNWKLIIQSFKAGVYTIIGKQKQELQSLRDQLAAKNKIHEDTLNEAYEQGYKEAQKEMEEENRKLREALTYMVSAADDNTKYLQHKLEEARKLLTPNP
jgi:hypothetical protein